ncbi:MAG: CPBP family intramembrane glutamic endopeptidase [Flavobacteriaceae bacterium]
MFIERAYASLHDAWRYVVGFLVIFFVWQMGSLPLLAAIMIKLISDGSDLSSLEDPNQMMTILESNTTLFLMLLSFVIGLVGLYFWVKWVHKQPMVALTTSRKKIDWSRFAFGFLLIAVSTGVMTLWDYYENPQDYELQFQVVPFAILAIIAVLMVPLQTSFEEYLFRGYLMQGIGIMARNRWAPLLITSFIFGGLHFFNPEVDKMGNIIMVYYIGTGLFLGIITLMDEGMELALGFHAGNNLVGALLVTADWTAFQTHSIFKDISDPSAGVDVIIPVLIVYPIFLGIMAWRYRWTGWKEKLFGAVDPPPNDSISEIGTT